jgi:WD40 repeat protein
VHCVAWSPDGNYLATASDDETAKVWNALTDHCVHTLQGHTNAVWCVAWSPDGKHLATASEDYSDDFPRGVAQVWDTATGQCVQSLLQHAPSVDSVAWSPNGKHLAIALVDESAHITLFSPMGIRGQILS